MYEESQVYDNTMPQQQTANDFINVDLVLTIVVVYAVICGIITASIAAYNHRSVGLAFVAGIFLGSLGIVAHMIMGERESEVRRKH